MFEHRVSSTKLGKWALILGIHYLFLILYMYLFNPPPKQTLSTVLAVIILHIFAKEVFFFVINSSPKIHLSNAVGVSNENLSLLQNELRCMAAELVGEVS